MFIAIFMNLKILRSLFKNTVMQGLLGTGYAKYTRLENEVESPTQGNFIEDTQQAQQLIIDSQEEQIERVGATVGTLKSMSKQIGSELDEQSV